MSRSPPNRLSQACFLLIGGASLINQRGQHIHLGWNNTGIDGKRVLTREYHFAANEIDGFLLCYRFIEWGNCRFSCANEKRLSVPVVRTLLFVPYLCLGANACHHLSDFMNYGSHIVDRDTAYNRVITNS
jgi:hypothetical protein